MTRTRAALLVVVAVAWLVLGIVNLTKSRTGVGVLYVTLGVLIGIAAWFAARSRPRP